MLEEFLDLHTTALRGATMTFAEFRKRLEDTTGLRWSNKRISEDLRALGIKVVKRTGNVTYVLGLVWATDTTNNTAGDRAFDHAVDLVDEQFGFGTAGANPALVAEFLARARAPQLEPDALTAATAILRMMREHKRWVGTASDLARAVEMPYMKDFRRAWPLIAECRELLATQGIAVHCLTAKSVTASRQISFSRRPS